MPTVTFDTIQNSVFERSGLSARILRGVVISDIDATGTADPDVLMKAQTAILAAGGATYPGSVQPMYFVGFSLTGFTTNGVSGYAIYETFQGGAPSSYVIRDRSYVQGVQTNMVPGLNTPIRTGWSPGAPGAAGSVRPDNITMTFNLPVSAIEVSGLVYGKPNGGIKRYVGYVNNAAWGPPGEPTKDIGWWMLFAYENAISKYSGYYTYQAVATCRNYADWSETGILFNSIVGKYVQVDDAAITAMNALPYKWGMIYPAAPPGITGVARTGGNPTTSFSAIFGF